MYIYNTDLIPSETNISQSSMQNSEPSSPSPFQLPLSQCTKYSPVPQYWLFPISPKPDTNEQRWDHNTTVQGNIWSIYPVRPEKTELEWKEGTGPTYQPKAWLAWTGLVVDPLPFTSSWDSTLFPIWNSLHSMYLKYSKCALWKDHCGRDTWNTSLNADSWVLSQPMNTA